jgi:hypothetical protein
MTRITVLLSPLPLKNFHPSSVHVAIRCLVGLSLCLTLTAIAYPQSSTPDIQNGLVPYGAFQHGDVDHVNLANGNVLLSIPLVSYPQRGGKLKLSFSAIENNKGWRINLNKTTGQRNWIYAGFAGVKVVPDQSMVHTFATTTYTDPDSGQVFTIDLINAITTDGSSHEILFPDPRFQTTGYSSDATGIRYTPTTLYDHDGLQYTGGSVDITSPPYSYVPGNVTDPNGNEVTYGTNGWTDTIGRVIPGYASQSSSAPGVSASNTNCPVGTLSALQWNLPGYSGSTAAIKFCYANFTIQTNFGVTGVAEASGTASLINAIVLPNLTMWQFSYDPYLDLASVSLPTGGSITYTWGTSNPYYLFKRVVTSRTVYDQSTSQQWKYQWNVYDSLSSSTNVVTAPPINGQSNDTVSVASGGYVGTSEIYQGSYTKGSLLKTNSITYSGAEDPMGYYGQSGGAINVVPLSQTVTWADGQTNQATTGYDPGFQYCRFIATDQPRICYNAYLGLPTKQTFSDFGSSYPILRQSSTVYQWQNNSSYLTANLLDLVQTSQIQDSSGHVCAETDYTYDDPNYFTNSSPAITEQHIAPPNSVRGNPSSVTRQLASPSTPCVATPAWTPITSHTNVYDTGTVYQSIDPLGDTTTYAYSSTFYGAYPTTITNALLQPTLDNYDFDTGLLTSVEDPNLVTTSYSYDNMFRLSQVTEPDGGLQTITHQETTYPFTSTLTEKITSTLNEVTTNVFDGLGRLTQHQITSDPQGTTYTLTVYDA